MGLDRKRGHVEMVLLCFLSHLLSSVCTLSALITAAMEVISPFVALLFPRNPQSRAHLLVTPFLAKKGGLRARIINLFYSFAVPVIPAKKKRKEKKDFILFNNPTIDLLPKLHPLRAVFIILWHCIEDTEEVMTWRWRRTASL